ncbi:hypothetical protein D3C85_1459340 [compost metagenome]
MLEGNPSPSLWDEMEFIFGMLMKGHDLTRLKGGQVTAEHTDSIAAPPNLKIEPVQNIPALVRAEPCERVQLPQLFSMPCSSLFSRSVHDPLLLRSLSCY